MNTVFIPAYNQAQLLIGCLKSVAECFIPEIYILDDSESGSDTIKYALQKLPDISAKYLPRLDDRQRSNHIASWNRYRSLIADDSEYINIRHHDDFIIPALSRSAALQFQHKKEPLLIINPILIPLFSCKCVRIARYHCPPLLLRLFLRYTPSSMLVLFNYIGPTACVWIRSGFAASAPVFDDRLTWLVDARWYSSLIARCEPSDIVVSTHIFNQTVNNVYSITSQLGTSISLIKDEEEKLLVSELQISQVVKAIALASKLVNRIASLLLIKIYFERA